MNTNDEYNVFTKDENGVNIAVNNLDVSCITNPNNKFAIDSEGNITANSITLAGSNNNPIIYEEIFDKIYPVGSVYLSVNNTNPGTLFGGNWEQIAEGRTLVGVDPYDTDFNRVKKIGGSKYLQNHTHDIYAKTNWGTEIKVLTTYSGPRDHGVIIGLPAGADGTYVDQTYGYALNKACGNGNSENLQPYYTCYIWCRIA